MITDVCESDPALSGIILSRLHKCPGLSLTCVRMKWAVRVSRSTTPAAFTTVYRINDFSAVCYYLLVMVDKFEWKCVFTLIYQAYAYLYILA